MKDVPSDVNLKASIAAVIVYAVVMGTIGAYWSVECGKHWFMYIISFSLFAVPVLIVIYALCIWLLLQYNAGRVRYWVLAAALSMLFFIGCFVYAHLQPDTPLYSMNDCQPF
jgi:cytochrome bd-type quinol oxidase subunit 2